MKKILNFKLVFLVLSLVFGFSSMVFAQFGSGASAPGSGSGASAPGSAQMSSVLCAFYSTIMNVIFILAVLLMVLGGALYAGSTIMPAQLKGQLQGYAYGMLMGGVVGLIIVLAGPYILKMIVGTSSTVSTTGCTGSFI